MLEDAPGIRAVAIFEEICRGDPGIAPGLRRTLERRIAGWLALNGPDRDVIFRQEHPPGRMGLSDLTDLGALGITIASERFDHRLYHFRLAFSGFANHIRIVTVSRKADMNCACGCPREGRMGNDVTASATHPFVAPQPSSGCLRPQWASGGVGSGPPASPGTTL